MGEEIEGTAAGGNPGQVLFGDEFAGAGLADLGQFELYASFPTEQLAAMVRTTKLMAGELRRRAGQHRDSVLMQSADRLEQDIGDPLTEMLLAQGGHSYLEQIESDLGHAVLPAHVRWRSDRHE